MPFTAAPRRLRRVRHVIIPCRRRLILAVACLGTIAYTASLFDFASITNSSFSSSPSSSSSQGLIRPSLSLSSSSSRSSNLLNVSSPLSIERKSDAEVVESSDERPKALPLKKDKPLWMLPPGEALIRAKKEIENAPLVVDDPELYPPLFRNLSVFKRQFSN